MWHLQQYIIIYSILSQITKHACVMVYVSYRSGRVSELAQEPDLKSVGALRPCGFNSHHGYHYPIGLNAYGDYLYYFIFYKT